MEYQVKDMTNGDPIVEDLADDGPDAYDVSTDNIIDFEGPDDPSNPMNWSALYKWSMVILISILSLIVNLAILMCAPATSYVLDEFHSSSKLQATLLVSIWELGEVIGPLVIAPLSESFGRLPAYHSANIFFILCTVAAAESTSMGMLIAMRFLLGFSVASTVINPCIVGDMFPEEHRGKAMSLMGMIPFVAPCLGPTIGGFVAEARGWRWTFWVTAMIAAPLQLLFLIFYRETYRVRILQKKAERLRKETGNASLRSRYELELSPSAMIARSFLRPLKMLLFCPVVLLVGLCGAVSMSLVYVIITSISEVYDTTYGFRKQFLGLTYFGLGVGMVLSTFSVGPFLDRYMQMKKQAGKGSPEDRVLPMLLGSILVPCGILAFGWSVEYKTHWVAPILFSVLVGYGYVSIAISAWSYLVDAFGIYAASATAGTVILRNAGAASLPLAGPSLIEKVGIGWGYSVLALLGAVAVPIPILLIQMGLRLRKLQPSLD
ncbi:MFS general substrate transporter [Trematosphaeria pertusa]|uniref:MFS general substrate transporter n=1 Tax=Trematosphaeria pertusa TaxID=390896 RepID=A0A6A6I049_9PLEO|nr:MFS general substrate transporter [Trematosphaeria pertusa]KAF2243378.1 MFS general substrate transporter [Trematosphaeria pertusa]